MIVVDTSAIAALLFGEPESSAIEAHLGSGACVKSAATLVELRIALARQLGQPTLFVGDDFSKTDVLAA